MASVLISLLVSAVIAQSAVTAPKPDFSGTWRLLVPQIASQPEPVFLVIEQTEKDVTIEWSRGESRQRASFQFTANPPTTLNVNGPRQAYWNGAALVTEGARVIEGQTLTVRETRTLNTTGTQMTVDSILVVQHGYAAPLPSATNYGSGRDVYIKVLRRRTSTQHFR